MFNHLIISSNLPGSWYDATIAKDMCQELSRLGVKGVVIREYTLQLIGRQKGLIKDKQMIIY